MKFNGLSWLNGFGCYKAREELRIVVCQKKVISFLFNQIFIYTVHIERERTIFALRMVQPSAVTPSQPGGRVEMHFELPVRHGSQ